MEYLANRKSFTTAVWHKADKIFLKAKINNLSKDGKDVEGEITLSKRYDISLRFDDNGNMIETKCTCPSPDHCVHEAALLLAVEHKKKLEEYLSKPIQEGKFTPVVSHLSAYLKSNPQFYFQLTKEIYLRNYERWVEFYRTDGINNIFRTAHDSRINHLGDEFLAFIDDVSLNNRALKNAFDYFYKMVIYEESTPSFLLKCFQDDRLIPVMNRIVIDYCYDYLYRPLFTICYDNPDKVIPHLSDEAVLSLFATPDFKSHEPILSYLMEKKNTSLLHKIYQGRYPLTFQEEKEVEDYFVDDAYVRQDRNGLEYIINHTDCAFKAIYYYYQLVPDKDKSRMAIQLEKVCNSLGYQECFQIMVNRQVEEFPLLSLDDFLLLQKEIKSKYNYKKKLRSSLYKSILARDGSLGNSKLILQVLDAYIDQDIELIQDERIRNYTMTSSLIRRPFLELLKKHHCLEEAGLTLYQVEA